MKKTIINDHGLLFMWKGSNRQKLLLLLTGHYDTMPATNEVWKYPSFSGAIADGYIWGRGTLHETDSDLPDLDDVD